MLGSQPQSERQKSRLEGTAGTEPTCAIFGIFCAKSLIHRMKKRSTQEDAKVTKIQSRSKSAKSAESVVSISEFRLK